MIPQDKTHGHALTDLDLDRSVKSLETILHFSNQWCCLPLKTAQRDVKKHWQQTTPESQQLTWRHLTLSQYPYMYKILLVSFTTKRTTEHRKAAKRADSWGRPRWLQPEMRKSGGKRIFGPTATIYGRHWYKY